MYHQIKKNLLDVLYYYDIYTLFGAIKNKTEVFLFSKVTISKSDISEAKSFLTPNVF